MSIFGGGRTRRRIEDLLNEADSLPVGPEERARLDEAIRLADESGEEELAYRARMFLTSSANVAGDTDTMIASFGWCVGRHDADPVRFPIDPGVYADLLFQYKWMARRLASNSRFSRERIAGIHDDMSRRYREAGVSQSGVLQSRFDVAFALGDIEEAARLQRERDAVPRDDYSHCEACVRSTDLEFAIARDERETGIRLWEEMLQQNLTCGEEPEYAESHVLLSLLRAGRADDAVAAHARSYRMARQNPDGFGMIAGHIEFCAVTGNLARGLQLLERHIHLLAHDPYNEQSHFSGLAAVGVLLDAVAAAGLGDTIVRGSDHPTLEPVLGQADGPRTAGALRDAAWLAAADIAARFDARNGNDWHAGRLAEKRALAEEHYEAPFGGEAFVPAAAVDAEPTDADGWLRRSRWRLFADDGQGVAEAVERGLAIATPAQAAELLKSLVWLASARQDTPAARSHHAERVAALRAAGRIEQAELEERTGLAMLGQADAADIARLEAELGVARTDGADRDVVIDLLVTIGAAYLEQERAEEAGVLIDEAAKLLPDGEDNPLRFAVGSFRLQALLAQDRRDEAIEWGERLIADPRNAGWPLLAERRTLANLLAGAGRLDEALPVAAQLLADAVRIDVAPVMMQAAHLNAMILADLGRFDEAAARIEFALAQAERAEAEQNTLRFTLARFQLEAGHALAALENFETTYLAEKESGEEPASIAQTLLWMGRAAMACSEPGMAYGVWGQAVSLAEEAGAAGLAAEAGSSLGELLIRFDDADAVGVLEQALRNAEQSDGAVAPPVVVEALGRARIIAGDGDGGLAELDRAIALGEADDAAWFAANARDSKGRALVDLGRADEGVPLLLAAADELAEAGDLVTAASGEAYAGRALAAAGRGDEAVAILHSARDRIEPGHPAHTGITLELAEVLDGLGRSGEATELRASVA